METLLASHPVAVYGSGQAPDWVHLIPAGRFEGRGGLDSEAFKKTRQKAAR